MVSNGHEASIGISGSAASLNHGDIGPVIELAANGRTARMRHSSVDRVDPPVQFRLGRGNDEVFAVAKPPRRKLSTAALSPLLTKVFFVSTSDKREHRGSREGAT